MTQTPERLLYFLADASSYRDLQQSSPVNQPYDVRVVPMTLEAYAYARQTGRTLELAPLRAASERDVEALAALDAKIDETLGQLQETNGPWLRERLGFDADIRLFRNPLAAWYETWFCWARALEAAPLADIQHVAYPYSIGFEYDLYPAETLTPIDTIVHFFAGRFTRLHPYPLDRRIPFPALKFQRRWINFVRAYRSVPRHSFLAPTPRADEVELLDGRCASEPAPGQATFDLQSGVFSVGRTMYLREIPFHMRDLKLESAEEHLNVRSFLQLRTQMFPESVAAQRMLRQWLINNLELLIDRIDRLETLQRIHRFRAVRVPITLDPIVLNAALWARSRDLQVEGDRSRDRFGLLSSRLPIAARPIFGDAPARPCRSEPSRAESGRTAYLIRPGLHFGEACLAEGMHEVDYLLKVSRFLDGRAVDIVDVGDGLGSDQGRRLAAALPGATCRPEIGPQDLMAYETVYWDQLGLTDLDMAAPPFVRVDLTASPADDPAVSGVSPLQAQSASRNQPLPGT